MEKDKEDQMTKFASMQKCEDEKHQALKSELAEAIQAREIFEQSFEASKLENNKVFPPNLKISEKARRFSRVFSY